IRKRKNLVWEIERKLAEDGARPVIFYGRGATCRQPYVKGLTLAANSIFNGWRMEHVWLDNSSCLAAPPQLGGAEHDAGFRLSFVRFVVPSRQSRRVFIS